MLEELEKLRDDTGVRFSASALRRLIEATGASAGSVNLAISLPIYLRALAEALLEAPQRYGDRPTEVLDFASLMESDGGAKPSGQTALPVHEVGLAPEMVASAPSAAASILAAPGPASARAAEMTGVDGGVKTIARKLIDKKVNAKVNAALKAAPGREHEARAKARGWDDKAVRQAEGIFDLFERFLNQEYGVDDLSLLRQQHLADFEEFLRHLNRNFGKGPRDKTRTIAELRAIAAASGPKVGTLMPGTLNRHLTYLGQLLRHARAVGVAVNPALSTGELRAEQPTRGRDQRKVPELNALERLLREPPFVGCAAWDRPHEPGAQLYHRALYFGTLLDVYGGVRREESCGLAVDDVVDDVSHPYILVRFNAIRRIKNIQSVRAIALHPELLRLGFLDYVRAMRALGYHRLFHDLYSPTGRSPMGDRYYDELLSALRHAGVTPHQLRHFFNDALKRAKVAKEFRADLLGHMGEGETDERYCDPVHIELQLELLAHLPIVSTHLETRPITLLPWVQERRLAPWSRGRRTGTSAWKAKLTRISFALRPWCAKRSATPIFSTRKLLQTNSLAATVFCGRSIRTRV